MILVDLNQVLISNLMAQTRGQFDELPDKNMLRHMVLNSLRGYNLKFKDEYGTPVLCADGGDPWRRDIFPNYKYKRKKGRAESDIDWLSLFKMIGEIRDEIAQNFPYIVLHIDKVEADDIIAVLVKECHTKEKIMIVSGDKDFIQLHRYPNVKQYAPIQKKFVESDDPVKYLHEQVIKGDRSDGVPNILSADDVFVTGTKQRPINKKRLEEWANIENIPLGSETKKYYERNKKLIDLDEIPSLIYNDIKSKYINYKVNDRTLLLTYFIENKLKSLIENINDF
jgi:5'-3' exonuclease|tara:strand:- start:2662 stop:3507 length:846 start_codon:yes stop_codon:yes gene_type:complete